MKFFAIVFLFYSYLTHGIADVSSECITPPLECPNVNVTFWLYTRANKDAPFEIKVTDSKRIKDAPWVKGAPIKVLIHGYTGYRDYSPNTEIRPVYLECCDYNIISIDYKNLALEPCYVQAARNTELVGMCTAQLIDELVSKHDIQLSDFHIIGFSLGGHVAGYIANYLKSGQLKRISALDPALPLFATLDKKKKIDAGDAMFVDAIHTNALQKGKLETSGQIDCFANGGMEQPGCEDSENLTKSGCDHVRAPIYFAESISTKVGFYGTKCYSWISYVIGWCELFYSDEEVICGEYVPQNANGIYFFNTNSEPPYARGYKKKSSG